MPTGLTLVAVVPHTGCVIRFAAVSPVANPLYIAEIIGGVPPKVIVPLLAVITSAAVFIFAVVVAVVELNM